MGAFAILNLPKFKRLLRKGNTIGDGLYSFEEYKILKKAFGQKFITIAIYSPPNLRHKRLFQRKVRPLTRKEAAARDFSEIENLNKGGTIALADYTTINDGSLRAFKARLTKIYREIN